MIGKIQDLLMGAALLFTGFVVWKLWGLVTDPIDAIDEWADKNIKPLTPDEVKKQIHIVQESTGVGWATEKKKVDSNFGMFSPYGNK